MIQAEAEVVPSSSLVEVQVKAVGVEAEVGIEVEVGVWVGLQLFFIM